MATETDGDVDAVVDAEKLSAAVIELSKLES
jgi:hypothetical protein